MFIHNLTPKEAIRIYSQDENETIRDLVTLFTNAIEDCEEECSFLESDLQRLETDHEALEDLKNDLEARLEASQTLARDDYIMPTITTRGDRKVNNTVTYRHNTG